LVGVWLGVWLLVGVEIVVSVGVDVQDGVHDGTEDGADDGVHVLDGPDVGAVVGVPVSTDTVAAAAGVGVVERGRGAVDEHPATSATVVAQTRIAAPRFTAASTLG
jgi:hypothetical protein